MQNRARTLEQAAAWVPELGFIFEIKEIGFLFYFLSFLLGRFSFLRNKALLLIHLCRPCAFQDTAFFVQAESIQRSTIYFFRLSWPTKTIPIIVPYF